MFDKLLALAERFVKAVEDLAASQKALIGVMSGPQLGQVVDYDEPSEMVRDEAPTTAAEEQTTELNPKEHRLFLKDQLNKMGIPFNDKAGTKTLEKAYEKALVGGATGAEDTSNSPHTPSQTTAETPSAADDSAPVDSSVLDYPALRREVFLRVDKIGKDKVREVLYEVCGAKKVDEIPDARQKEAIDALDKAVAEKENEDL